MMSDVLGWFVAETTAPNWVYIVLLSSAFLGLTALSYARKQLEKSTQKWEDVYELYIKILARPHGDK